jgi:AraC-like DNA-binding protein
MKLNIQIDINIVGKKLLEEHLDKLQVDYILRGIGEVEINESISSDKLKELAFGLRKYGIEIVESEKNILIQKIKDAIIEMVYMDDKLPITSSVSSYLSDKLKCRYGYISSLFSTITFTSIENFVKLQKIERAKLLISNSELSCSEIAWKLNYSSVPHFSSQFKNVTGLTPTTFQRIIKKRREAQNEEQEIEIGN